MADKIAEFLERIEPSLVKQRRALHRHPELGFTEYVTTYEISKQLEKLGYALSHGHDIMVSQERMGVPKQQELEENEERALEQGVPQEFLNVMKGGHTGVIARMDTGRPGPHFAFRFDIDALPINEAEDPAHKPHEEQFISERPGVMHACGHDGHASIGLGVANYLQEQKEQLNGTFTLIFQPAEEGGRGAKAIVKKGWLDGVDYFISGHLGLHHFEPGVIASSSTNFLASSKLNVEFKGKSAHSGLEPNAGKNALLAASSAMLHLNTIPRHKDGATRVNVGKMHGGSGRNIVADYAYMELETRGATNELDRYMQEHAKRILQASADLYDVQMTIEEMGQAISAESDPEWHDIVVEACRGSETIIEVKRNLPLGASEDVTYMMDRVQEQGGKATFMIFASPLPAGHHHPYFDYEEKSISAGVEAITRTVDYLVRNNG
ncbi:amidohydrolase [Planococcus salinus]|uniref:Amidohydrolase n=1 Tax=Planococcus salinus TaxID=1848460 RepID=A0A3M8P8R0_9BACL|nr:amidohydrolase [Planococcus salinus]RNF39584.1 amidohydrolase [Planococcus salinus]